MTGPAGQQGSCTQHLDTAYTLIGPNRVRSSVQDTGLSVFVGLCYIATVVVARPRMLPIPTPSFVSASKVTTSALSPRWFHQFLASADLTCLQCCPGAQQPVQGANCSGLGRTVSFQPCQVPCTVSLCDMQQHKHNTPRCCQQWFSSHQHPSRCSSSHAAAGRATLRGYGRLTRLGARRSMVR